MTEKRFIPIFFFFDKRVVGAKDNGKIISFMDMFDLLNEQEEIIKTLDKEVSACYDTIHDKEERIKELQQIIDTIAKDYE